MLVMNSMGEQMFCNREKHFFPVGPVIYPILLKKNMIPVKWWCVGLKLNHPPVCPAVQCIRKRKKKLHTGVAKQYHRQPIESSVNNSFFLETSHQVKKQGGTEKPYE